MILWVNFAAALLEEFGRVIMAGTVNFPGLESLGYWLGGLELSLG